MMAVVDTYSTRQIADTADVSISTVLRHAVRLGIKPTFELPGVRGAKLWDAAQRVRLLESINESMDSWRR
jgi:transposase